MMDAINRYRFQNESALLAAWKAAKHVVTGPQTEEEKGPLELGVGHLPRAPVRQGWKATLTGAAELVAVPSPNWPYSLSPQQ